MKNIFRASALAFIALAASGCGKTSAPTADEYLDFLYSAMPAGDSIDYSRDFWIENIETSMRARREMPWGESVPEREFRHFVLPVRVNNEDLDSSRMVFYRELAPRIKGMTMAEAALEVNHWLHEKATYWPSDGRTSSPLATVKTTLGRCGEESTLGVAAFRSVGIPARQVYTPRWAHTDDNHAWVEVWIDGKWHFLGACEPEPLLDMAWFNAPAARGMMMCTNVFGRYDGPEQSLYTDSCYTRINITSNYAPVRKVRAKVMTPDGSPASDAEVSFRLYNYAEYYPLFTTRTDSDGFAEVECGNGDIVVWARDNGGNCNFTVSSPGSETTELTLLSPADFKASMPREMVLTPPQTATELPQPTPEQTALNDRRKAAEDSIRNARMAGFFNDATASAFIATLAPGAQADSAAIKSLLTKSYGNGATWTEALRNVGDDMMPAFLDWTSGLTEKDLRDITPEVIADCFTPQRVVNPRISNERLTAFCSAFDTLVPADLAGKMKADPAMIPAWISVNIRNIDGRNPNRYVISPAGVFRSRMADSHSRDVFFVALCRWLGIPAQIDPVTGKTEWNPDGKVMRAISLEEKTIPTTETVNDKGSMALEYPQGLVPKNPGYFHHFTLSRLENGTPALLDYDEEVTAADFAGGKELESGEYLLTTGRRLADGSVLCRTELLDIAPGCRVNCKLTIPDDPDALSVVGSVNADPLLPVTGRGFFIYAFLSPGHEPTQHLINELKANRSALEAWGKKIVLMFPDGNAAARMTGAMRDGLPANVVIIDEPKPELLGELAAEFEFSPSLLPAVIVGDTFNRVIYHSEGYRPGLGQKLSEIVSRLKE